MEELTPKFVHYFLGGHRNASASSSTMHGTSGDVTLYYHVIYVWKEFFNKFVQTSFFLFFQSDGRRKAVYHRAILVHNSGEHI
jgi:hypothetical protein